VRDLLVTLGHRRATVVGHSLGGGVAMQFAYEYPPFAERLVLVSSGGLGREVHPLLRAATLPGSELVLPLIANERIHGLGGAVGQLLGRLGLRAGPDLAEMARGYGSLADAGARQAFIHSLRAVLDITGQRVSATDRLYLGALLPSLIIWGSRDPLIPVEHATVAQRGLGQPPRGLRGRGPLPPAAPSGALRPDAHRFHRDDRTNTARLHRRRLQPFAPDTAAWRAKEVSPFERRGRGHLGSRPRSDGTANLTTRHRDSGSESAGD